MFSRRGDVEGLLGHSADSWIQVDTWRTGIDLRVISKGWGLSPWERDRTPLQVTGKSKRGSGLKVGLWRTPVLSWGRGSGSREEVEEGWPGELGGSTSFRQGSGGGGSGQQSQVLQSSPQEHDWEVTLGLSAGVQLVIWARGAWEKQGCRGRPSVVEEWMRARRACPPFQGA